MTDEGRAASLGERLAAALARPGGTLLVLRAFLGVTFCVAGLQKLANPNFFHRAAPGSFYAQTAGAIATSPLHHPPRPRRCTPRRSSPC